MSSLRFTPLFKSVRSDRAVASLSDSAARFWFMLLAQSDAHGRTTADTDILAADVWPLRRATPNDTQVALTACVEAGLVERHELDLQRWLQIVDWDDSYGSIGRNKDKPVSDFPDPSEDSLVSTGSHRESPAPTDEHEDSPDSTDQDSPSPSGTDNHLARARVRSGDADVDAGADVRAPDGVPPITPSISKPKRRRSADQWQDVLARPDYAPLRESAAFQTAWASWIEHCRTPHTSATLPAATQAAVLLNRALKCLKHERGIDLFVQAVDDSIANNWQGINPKWVRDASARSSGASASPPATPPGEPQWRGESRDQRRAEVVDAWRTLGDDVGKQRPELVRRATRTLEQFGGYFPDIIPATASKPYPWQFADGDNHASSKDAS